MAPCGYVCASRLPLPLPLVGLCPFFSPHPSLAPQILQERLKHSDAQDSELLPLLECLAGLAPAFGSRFELYAKECYEKAVYVLSLHIGAQEAEQARLNGWSCLKLRLVGCSLHICEYVAESQCIASVGYH